MRLLSNVSAVSEANEPRLNGMAPSSAFDSRASELFSCHAVAVVNTTKASRLQQCKQKHTHSH
jgi:hypothetical protein